MAKNRDTTSTRALYGKREDRYLELVRRFPLRPLRTDADLDAAVVVRDNVVGGVALVDGRLEDLHPLARNFSAAQTANQLFTLAAEHGTANHFNPSKVSAHCIH